MTFPFLRRDRRGVAALEAALVLPTFLTMVLVIIRIGIYFILQSALDLGVTASAESLRGQVQAGAAFSAPAAATLKSGIVAAGGALLSASNVAVDVQLLSALSAGPVAVSDGSDSWGGSGSVLVLRAQTSMTVLPGFPALSLMSAAIIRRPPY